MKAQSSLDFLVTYAWAFLVILIAIGALMYFGVLGPNKLISTKCQFSTGITCMDYGYNEGVLEAVIVNNFDRSFEETKWIFTVTDCPPLDAAFGVVYSEGGSPEAVPGVAVVKKPFWLRDEKATLKAYCTSGFTDKRPQVKVRFFGNTFGGYEAVAEGEYIIAYPLLDKPSFATKDIKNKPITIVRKESTTNGKE